MPDFSKLWIYKGPLWITKSKHFPKSIRSWERYFGPMYHLAGIELHRASEPLAHIGISVLVYSCSVGSHVSIVLEAQQTVVHSESCRHEMSLLKEAKGQRRNDTLRCTRKRPHPHYTSHIFWLVSAIAILMVKYVYQHPWSYKDRELKGNQQWWKWSCSPSCHCLKKSFCFGFREACTWEY